MRPSARHSTLRPRSSKADARRPRCAEEEQAGTTLHDFARVGDLEGLRERLRAGDYVDQLDSQGATPLNIAILHGHLCGLRSTSAC